MYKRQLWLTLDNEQHQDRLDGGDDGSLDVGSTFYVGGTANKEALPWPLYSRRRDFYRGCIWDLRLDERDIIPLQRLRREQGMTGISPGCATMPHECATATCEHGSSCHERWIGHLCDCAMTSYTGVRCQSGQLTPTTYLK